MIFNSILLLHSKEPKLKMEKIKKKIDMKPSEVIRRALGEYIEKLKKKHKI